MLSGRLPLIWAHAQLIRDSPVKKKVGSGAMVGRLMHRAVANATSKVQSELLMITPCPIPGDEGMQMFKGLRRGTFRFTVANPGRRRSR